MKRRQFIARSGVFIAAASVTDVLAADDEAVVKRIVQDSYDVFYMKMDQKKYLSMLTDDYRLLENGEIFDANGDISFMPKPEDKYRRTDIFDFQSVKIQGDFAYTVYFLKSDITDNKKGHRAVDFLESTILRRNGNNWRIALLHSTRLVKP
jgi:ketosteroid isomerase-like protein